jgi:hypothetical protein
MIARHRGDHRVHSRWRPRPSQPALPTTPESPGANAQASPIQDVNAPRHRPWRSITVLVSGALVMLAIVVAIRHATTTRAASAVLPATPVAWVQQFAASALDKPTDVCRRLFASALAAAFKGDTGKSCLAYYSQVESRSYRHTLQDGSSGAVEAQQLGDGRTFGYFTILLTRLQAGWQAIDIVPGGSMRPR